MRNLKRAISLALASVMLMGMMVVGTSAKNFGDVDASNNENAIYVAEALGIMAGKGENFDPAGIVTREEMSTVVARLLEGEDFNANVFAGSGKFVDVAGRWSEGFVNYCYSVGATSGVSDTEFGFNNQVTTAQAALMIMKALGYFQNPEVEFARSGWELSSMQMAGSLGLLDGIDTMSGAGLSREDVAQMAYNALFIDAVQYNKSNETYYNTAKGWIGGVEENTTTPAKEVFKMTDASSHDVMGRPVTEYTKKGTVIATVVATPDYVITDKVDVTTDTKKELLDMINNDTITDFTVMNNDGDTITNIELLEGKAGLVIEIYVDADATAKAEIVAYTNYVSKVTSVKTDDDGVTTVKGTNGLNIEANGFKKNDIVTFTKDAGNKGKTISIAHTDTVQGEITSIASDVTTTVEVDGESYTYAKAFVKIDDTHVTDAHIGNEVELVLDANGYVVALTVDPAADATANYLYFAKAADYTALNGLQAKVVLADGTTQVVTIAEIFDAAGKEIKITAVGDMDEALYSYTINDDDDYVITELATDDKFAATSGVEIKTNKPLIGLGLVANDDTIFVDVDNNKIYTGIANVPSFTVGLAVVADAAAEVVFITAGDADDATADETYVFVNDADYSVKKVGDDKYKVYTDAYVDGVQENLYVAYGQKTLDAKTMYTVKTLDDNGYVASMDSAKIALSAMKTFTVSKISGDVIWDANYEYTYTVTADTLYYIINEKDGTVESATMSDIYEDTTDLTDENASVIFATGESDKKNTVADVVYIIVAGV